MTEQHTTGQELLDGRESVYGERVKNMEDVAKVWSGIFGFDVRADQVTLAMIGYKLVRASGAPDYSDNIDDVEGYALMFREIIDATGGMINAKSVSEYLEKKSNPVSHLTPAQQVMWAETQHVRPEEACVNCRSTSCDGKCEDERVEWEREVQKQWRERPEALTAEDRAALKQSLQERGMSSWSANEAAAVFETFLKYGEV